MIEVEGLERRYGRLTALAGVSFRVGTGEIAGLLGPNGAGKSTVMKILTGSLAPSAGRAAVAGRDLAREALAARRAVGFMPEHVALPGDEPVWSTLEFVADLKGVPRAGRRAQLETLLEQTGLQEVRYRLSGRLSHGYRKRLGLAQALVGDPPVLVLDEPTSGLDPNQIVGIRELIRGFRGRRTVLLSSHILSEVAALCERVVILDRGRVVAERTGEGLAAADPLAAGLATRTVVLSWDGDREKVAAALARVTGVDDVTITATGAEVSIAGNPVEIRPRLVESVLAAGGLLQNVHDKGPSLEELFMRLTGAAAGEAPPADTPPAADEQTPGAPPVRILWAITRRELAAFFHSAVAPVVLTGFLIAVGLFFTNFVFGYSEMSLAALQSPSAGNFLNLAEGLFRPLVSNTVFFLLFLLPALSMRLMAPDLRPGRRELVASWPVGDGTWILGKWLGGALGALALIGAGAAYILAVWTFGRPEAGPAFTAVLGQALLAVCLVAWGLLASCLVAHQVVAYFLAFVVSLALFLVGVFERFVPGPAGAVARELSLLTHFEQFSRGVIATQDLLYFTGMTAIALVCAWAVHAGRRLPPGRRLGPWTPALLTIVVVVLVYLVGARFPHSWDLTGNRRYSLAPQSLQVLDRLGDLLEGKDVTAGERGAGPAGADHVQVYAFYQKLDPARDVTEALLKACTQRTRRLRFSVIDPEVDLDLFRKYQLGSARSVVVTVGDRHTTLVQPDESALLSAVYRLASGRLSRVMFLGGHGEHLLDNQDRPGYSSCAAALTDQGYDVKPLVLAGGARVPESCDVLVLAGPRLDPAAGETAAIDAFLARGGALLALTDPPTPPGWAAWLQAWHLVPTGEVLIDAERLAAEQGMGPRTVALIDTYSQHEIVQSLHGLVTTFPLSQPLLRTAANDTTLYGGPLLTTGDRSWGETDPATMFTGRPEFDPQADRRGPLPFGWVLEARRGGGRPGRLVVIGNSEFLNNATVNQGANRDLLLNAIGWLAREEALIEVRGRDPLNQPVVLTRTQKEVYGWGAILGWPVLVGSLALGNMLRRRREPGQRP